MVDYSCTKETVIVQEETCVVIITRQFLLLLSTQVWIDVCETFSGCKFFKTLLQDQ